MYTQAQMVVDKVSQSVATHCWPRFASSSGACAWQFLQTQCVQGRKLKVLLNFLQERKAREKELTQVLAERQEDLARLQVEEESLKKMKAEQDLLIAKLSDASSGTPF